MALRGNLKELSLPDIFQLVTFSGKTGVLRIHRPDGAQGSVWFRDGDVFFAQSNWRTEPLGERLVRAQRITPMALKRALELRAAEPDGGRRLGQILVEGGYITDKVLESFVQEQMQDTIFDLMRWDDGDFEFEAMPDTLEEDIGLAVSIENVIMEGSRRLDEWNRIKKKIPSTDIVLKMATAPGEGTFEISLKPIEWNLLLLVDGTRSVAVLAVETGRTDFEVARILYGLFSAGLLEFASDEEVAASRAERAGREARLAELEAKRIAEERAASPVVAEPRAELHAEQAAQAPAALDEEGAAAATTAAAVEPARIEPMTPAEVPEFLGADIAPGTHDDVAEFEAAMGAVLEAQAPTAPAPSEPVAPYTPGEEPAFIAASRESGAAIKEPQPSVEELFADLAEQTRVVEEPAAAPQPALGLEAAPEPEVELAPVPEAAPPSEPALAPEPAPEPEPEAAPRPVAEREPIEAQVTEPTLEAAAQEPQPVESVPLVGEPEVAHAVDTEPRPTAVEEPTPEAGLAPAPSLDLEPDLMSVASGLEVPDVAEERTPVLEPGTYVIVPGPVPPSQPVTRPAERVEEPVLAPSAMPTTPPEPELPAAAFVPPSELATVPPATGSVASTPPGLQAFEHDLMSLGLGELPAELRAGEPSKLEIVQLPQEEEFELEPVVEPMGVSGPQASVPAAYEEVVASPAETSTAKVGEEADFSALLESFDISADDAQAAAPQRAEASVEPDTRPVDALLGEPARAAPGVISTDAYLDDLSLEGDFAFSGELTDELSALTGADRPARPVASVRRLPAEGETLLHRDTRVDRDTLLKIIEGVKNL